MLMKHVVLKIVLERQCSRGGPCTCHAPTRNSIQSDGIRSFYGGHDTNE